MAAPQDGDITVTVRSSQGTTYTVSVHRHSLVSDLKLKVADLTTVPPSRQRLIFKGRVLVDEVSLESSNIVEGSQLFLTSRLPVGPVSVETESADAAPDTATHSSQFNADSSATRTFVIPMGAPGLSGGGIGQILGQVFSSLGAPLGGTFSVRAHPVSGDMSAISALFSGLSVPAGASQGGGETGQAARHNHSGLPQDNRSSSVGNDSRADGTAAPRAAVPATDISTATLDAALDDIFGEVHPVPTPAPPQGEPRSVAPQVLESFAAAAVAPSTSSDAPNAFRSGAVPAALTGSPNTVLLAAPPRGATHVVAHLPPPPPPPPAPMHMLALAGGLRGLSSLSEPPTGLSQHPALLYAPEQPPPFLYDFLPHSFPRGTASGNGGTLGDAATTASMNAAVACLPRAAHAAMIPLPGFMLESNGHRMFSPGQQPFTSGLSAAAGAIASASSRPLAAAGVVAQETPLQAFLSNQILQSVHAFVTPVGIVQFAQSSSGSPLFVSQSATAPGHPAATPSGFPEGTTTAPPVSIVSSVVDVNASIHPTAVPLPANAALAAAPAAEVRQDVVIDPAGSAAGTLSKTSVSSPCVEGSRCSPAQERVVHRPATSRALMAAAAAPHNGNLSPTIDRHRDTHSPKLRTPPGVTSSPKSFLKKKSTTASAAVVGSSRKSGAPVAKPAMAVRGFSLPVAASSSQTSSARGSQVAPAQTLAGGPLPVNASADSSTSSLQVAFQQQQQEQLVFSRALLVQQQQLLSQQAQQQHWYMQQQHWYARLQQQWFAHQQQAAAGAAASQHAAAMLHASRSRASEGTPGPDRLRTVSSFGSNLRRAF